MPKVQMRLDRDGSVARPDPGGAWEVIEPRTDCGRVDATTEAEIAHQIAEDEAEARRADATWARWVRRRAGLSQSEFARRIGVPKATVQGWERGTHPPDGAARALLRVIERMPEATLAALAA